MVNLTINEAIKYMNKNNCELKHVITDEKDRWIFTCKVEDRIYGADATDMLEAISRTKEYIEGTNTTKGELLAA
jgi:hypothetical protein